MQGRTERCREGHLISQCPPWFGTVLGAQGAGHGLWVHTNLRSLHTLAGPSNMHRSTSIAVSPLGQSLAASDTRRSAIEWLGEARDVPSQRAPEQGYPTRSGGGRVRSLGHPDTKDGAASRVEPALCMTKKIAGSAPLQA